MAETKEQYRRRRQQMKAKRKDPVLRLLDLRSVDARKVTQWRAELVESFGGKLSPAKKEQIEQACLLKYLLDNVNKTLLKKAKSGESIGASLRDHNRLMSELREVLKGLGVEEGLSLDAIRRELSA